MKRVRIGGQAVMEGVMMKNGDRYAVAVRKPDKDIEVKVVDYVSMASRSVFFRVPIIRGVVNFVESLVIGVKTLTYSASFYDDEEPEKAEKEKAEKEKKEKKKERTPEQQKRADDAAMIGTVLFSLVFAIALFMMLPAFIGELIDKVIDNRIIMSAIEGVIRLGIFLGYVALISLMKDIQRVFMYHGAEHIPRIPSFRWRYGKRCGQIDHIFLLRNWKINVLPFSLHGFPAPFRRRFPALPLGGSSPGIPCRRSCGFQGPTGKTATKKPSQNRPALPSLFLEGHASRLCNG